MSEPGTVDQPPAPFVPSAATERALARVSEQMQAIEKAEMDENLRAEILNMISEKAVELRECEILGDRIVTFDQHTRCNDVYSDGGKVCSDSSECEGLCEVEGGARAGAEITGMCEAEEGAANCSAIIMGGVVRPTVCVN